MNDQPTDGSGANGADGAKRNKRKRPVGGSGAVLGVTVVRHWFLYSTGSFLMIVISIASVLVVAIELGKANLGQFGLLTFYAALIQLVYNMGSRSGTYKLVFGGDDEDDDDEDEDDDLIAPDETRKALGTGIILTAAVAIVGTLITIPLLPLLSETLLGDPNHEMLVLWAAICGGMGAIWKVIANVERLERRPVSNILLNAGRPVLILAGVVGGIVAGYGLEGAIAGMALGTAASVVVGLWVIRQTWLPAIEWRLIGQIYRRGSHRIPIIVSLWTVQNADTFLLSRFVSHSDLGLYQIASKTGMAVAFLPAAFFQAWRPIKRMSVFAAMEEEYGIGESRGAMLNYFGLLFITTLLGISMLAGVVVNALGDNYSDAIALIPLVALGLMAPQAHRAINKAAKFPSGKRLPSKKMHYALSVTASALLFIAFALFLIPRIGLAGAPLAMIIAFGITCAVYLVRSQLGPEPVNLPVRELGSAAALAVVTALVYDLISPEGRVLEFALALALLAVYGVAVFAVGAVPVAHRRALMKVGLNAIGRGRNELDSQEALLALDDTDRAALRMAVVEGRPLDEVAAAMDEDPPVTAERTVRALRELSALTGHTAGDASERDAEIGEFLFLVGPVAQRDLVGKKLLSAGVEPHDLHAIENALNALRKVGASVWPDDGDGAESFTPPAPTRA